MKAVLWGYKYDDMKSSWAASMDVLARSLRDVGYEVVLKNLKSPGLDWCRDYDPAVDNPCDLVIYNHCDISHLGGNVIEAKRTLFFKPTIPDLKHFTLDELGYGPYSTITYDRPDFEGRDHRSFYADRVDGWVYSRLNKFSDTFTQADGLPEDYWLIVGQCAGDETVTRYDFGDHRKKIVQITREVARVSSIPVVVKLHPYMDGTNAKDTTYSEKLAEELRTSKIKVIFGKVDIHSMLPRARAVILANSGAGIEAMMHNKPIIAWGHPEYHWITYDLRHLADLKRALRLDWFDAEKQAEWLTWYYEDYCVCAPDRVVARLRQLGLGK